MPRLFIALPFNEADLKKQSMESVYFYLKKYNKELKVVSPENYHITLKFLGECSNKTAEKIMENFHNIICGIKKILPFTLSGIGVFPDLKNTNVIWAGLKTDELLINKLNNDIDNFTANFGFKNEKRKFVPHLTLARVRKGMTLNQNLRQYIVENKEIFFYESNFKKLVLFESKLDQEGPVYTEIQSIEFAGEVVDE